MKESIDYYEFKARFVAKGFEQLYGLNYIDTFASVVKQMAWRLIFALAVLNSWFIYKVDMISAPYSAELAVKYQEKLELFEANNQKALGALKSLISLENQERFKDKKTAKELYNAIKTTFGSTSLEQIGRYINKIVDTNYSSYKSIDEYTSVIQSSAIS